MSKVTGENLVQNYLNQKASQIAGPLTNKFVTEVLIAASAHIAYYTPVDTSFLINSQYRKVTKKGGGYEGVLAWGAEYARAVNYGPDRDWKKAGASNQFVEQGVEDMIKEDLQAIIDRNYRQ